MSLFNRPIKQIFGTILVLFSLSACQTLSSGDISALTQDSIDRIDIGDADTRLKQIFNRYLADNLNQRGGLRDLALSTSLTTSTSSTLAVKGKSSTLSKTTMAVNYTLTDKMTGEALATGQVTASATSGTIASYYGQDKSKQFAAERLTRKLADKLALRLRRLFLEIEPTSQ